MKKLRFITLALLGITSNLIAYVHPAPGNWALEAEFLYLLPSVDDTYFVIDGVVGSDAVIEGERINNDFGFDPAFRVGGVFAFCDCAREFRAYYTRLRSVHSKTVVGDSLSATVGDANFAADFEDFAGSASSRNDLLYQRVDALFTQLAWCGCGLEVTLVGGLEFASLRLNEQNTYEFAGSAGFYNLHGKTWGVGPEMGLEVNYQLCEVNSCCPGVLSIASCTTGSLLASKTRQHFLTEASIGGEFGTFVDVNDRHTWRIVPAFHTRVGLNYATSFNCFGAALEVGYEFNSYIRGLARKNFPDDVAVALDFTSYYNFDVQGLYIAAAVTF